jgi:hypothetical protein
MAQLAVRGARVDDVSDIERPSERIAGVVDGAV